jgi:hypothetical protein
MHDSTAAGISNCRTVGAGMSGLLHNLSAMGQVKASAPSTAHTRKRCGALLKLTI